METQRHFHARASALVLLCALLALAACDDNGTEPEEGSGATLQGRVTVFDASGSSVASAGAAAYLTPGVLVSIGTLEAQTDTSGDFIFHDIPLGDQVVHFAREGAVGSYALHGITRGATFTLEDVHYSGGAVSTAHTGTWVGTGGSTDPGSMGQVALTMILEANGNALSGTASVGSPDNTVWSISGTETGTSVDGSMSVVSTESPCASGGTFTGAFDADTLSGSFVEVDPPAGCGVPEHGTFRVVKQ